jgi:hypothetical protein
MSSGSASGLTIRQWRRRTVRRQRNARIRILTCISWRTVWTRATGLQVSALRKALAAIDVLPTPRKLISVKQKGQQVHAGQHVTALTP